MDFLQQLNNAMQHMEAHLCEELDFNRLAEITCTSADGFARIFSYLTGISVCEYVRRRRLTRAAYELQDSKPKVIDLALKYGYESSDSFTRAFVKHHGITPTKARRQGALLKMVPPVSFHIILKGRKEMNYRIVEKEAFAVTGIRRAFEGEASQRWELEHEIWAFEREQVSDKIPGLWYGIWNQGEYIAAKEAGSDCKEGLIAFTIPAGRYAVFESGRGGFAGDVLPEMRKQIFEEWLPDTGYQAARDFEVEVYHLFDKNEKHKRHYELWIPLN